MQHMGPSSGFGHIGAGKLRPRGADGWGPGAAMSFGVHLMLVAALALGVQWKIDNPEVIEAEMWSEIPRAAAPADVPPPPPPAVTPRTREADAPPAEDDTPPRQSIPDLVIAKQEEKKKPKREPVEVFESAPPKKVPPKVEKKPEKPPEKAPPKKPEPAKVEKKAEPVPSKVTSPQGTAQSAAEREAQRKAQLQRMMSQLGELGTSESSGPSASYAGRIRARIKPNLVFTDSISGNRPAVVELRCAPDGRIISRKLIESSGMPRWDEAVLRAIDRTEVLPADENGKVPPVMQISYRPEDM